MLCAHIKNCPVVAAIVMAKELNEKTVNDVLLGKTDEHEGTLDVSNSADGQNDPKNHSAGLAGKTSTDGTVSQSKPMATNTLHGQLVGTAKPAQPKAPLGVSSAGAPHNTAASNSQPSSKKPTIQGTQRGPEGQSRSVPNISTIFGAFSAAAVLSPTFSEAGNISPQGSPIPLVQSNIGALMATGPQQVLGSQQLVGPALGGTGGPGAPLQSAGSELGGVYQHGPHINPAQPCPAHNNGVQPQSFGFNYSHSSGTQPVDYYGTSSIVGNQLSKSAKNHTSGHGDDGNASSIPGVQLAAAFSKTQAALVSSDSDAVKSGDPIAGKNHYSAHSKPRTLSELIDQIDYIVEETLKKHILSSPLNIPFPDDCVVKVAGTTEWINATVCERYFNFKFR